MTGKNVFDNILGCIGNTPLVKINRLNPNPSTTIFAKLEFTNPGGSIKDRVALSMIEDAEKKGLLTKDKIIIEATSGNTGIGLAVVAAVKGYKLVLAMPETASLERQKILRALGAELLLTPGNLGTDGAIEEVYRLVRENPDLYFMPDQFNNPANPLAHYYGTGREIFEQTDGKVNVVVVALGTTGTAMGILRAVKERNPSIEVVAVEPYPGHKIQGLKNMKESYVPEIFDRNALDKIIHIKDEDAFEMARRLAKEEGIFVGMSSGAAMAAAVEIAKERKDGIIVTVFPDGGDRYLSTNLFTVMIEPDFYFYDYLQKKLINLKPTEEGKVKIYITGPPLDKVSALQELRRFFVLDLLSRFLESKGFSVLTIVSIPDLDSRTIQQAKKSNRDFSKYVSTQLDNLFSLLERFNIKRHYRYAKVSEYSGSIVANIKELIDKTIAYEKLKSVYFNIGAFNDYGKLAHIDPQNTIPRNKSSSALYEKQNPRDFTLLKRASLPELKEGLYIKTQWGNMLPTWHIAAVSIILDQWKPPVDIYVSSTEFVFPHLENVRSIAEALKNKPLAKLWLICERVWSDRDSSEEKLSNEVSLIDLLDRGFHPEEIRFWILSTHYRKPLHASIVGIKNSLKAYKRIKRFITRLHSCKTENQEKNHEISELVFKLEQQFFEALSKDLDTPKALSALFSFIRETNPHLLDNNLSKEDKHIILNALKKIGNVLGLFMKDLEEPPRIILELLKQREEARKKGDWQKADYLRNELKKLGVAVYDTPKGTQWEWI